MSLMFSLIDGSQVSVATVEQAADLRQREIANALDARTGSNYSESEQKLLLAAAAGLFDGATLSPEKASFVAALAAAARAEALLRLDDAIAWETAKAAIAAILASGDTDEVKLAALAIITV